MTNIIVREGARRVDTDQQDEPLYSPEVIMSWPEFLLLILATAATAAMLVWFFAANWPRLVVWLSF